MKKYKQAKVISSFLNRHIPVPVFSRNLKWPVDFYAEDRNHRKGFTLTEIMIVILIIGLFAVFSIPTLQGLAVRGRWKEVLYNLYAVKDASRAYHFRYDKYPNPDAAWPYDLYLNGSYKGQNSSGIDDTSNTVSNLCMLLPEPGDLPYSFIYVLYKADIVTKPNVVGFVFNDLNSSELYESPEPFIEIYYDGTTQSFNDAPDFAVQ